MRARISGPSRVKTLLAMARFFVREGNKFGVRLILATALKDQPKPLHQGLFGLVCIMMGDRFIKVFIIVEPAGVEYAAMLAILLE